jgi:hypothetical protein
VQKIHHFLPFLPKHKAKIASHAQRPPATMHVRVSEYRPATGWQPPLPAELDGPQTLVIAFGASEYGNDPAPFAQLAQALPRSLHVGCSSAGEIAGEWLSDGSISLAVVRFEQTQLVCAATTLHGTADSTAAGARLAAQIAPALGSAPLRAVFALTDGLGVNGTALLKGLSRGLPAAVPVSGGMAGDGRRFGSTWVYGGPRSQGHPPAPMRACAVALYGAQLQVGHGSATGWLDFGPERRITRAEGNVVFELDGQPALALYKKYLGELAAGLPGTALLFPLSVRQPGSGHAPLVRTILAVDEARHALVFAGDVAQGAVGRLMRTRIDALVGSSQQAVAQAAAALPAEGESLVISVSCVGRRLVLGERTEDEVEAVMQGCARGTRHVGFYSYGEFAPGANGRASELHNQTMTLTAFSECGGPQDAAARRRPPEGEQPAWGGPARADGPQDAAARRRPPEGEQPTWGGPARAG